MFAPFKAFKNPAILDVETHKDLKIAKPYDYSFMQDVETVPLTFSELLSCSMYYPVMFGIFEGEIFPFAAASLKLILTAILPTSFVFCFLSLFVYIYRLI